MSEATTDSTERIWEGNDELPESDKEFLAIGIAEQAQDDRSDPGKKQGRGMFSCLKGHT
jgi:hypothetical protein